MVGFTFLFALRKEGPQSPGEENNDQTQYPYELGTVNC